MFIGAVIDAQASYSNFSHPSAVHGARISGLEARMTIVEDKMCDLDARGSEEADNLANERELDRFIITGDLILLLTCYIISRPLILILRSLIGMSLNINIIQLT